MDKIYKTYAYKVLDNLMNKLSQIQKKKSMNILLLYKKKLMNITEHQDVLILLLLINIFLLAMINLLLGMLSNI